MIAQNPLSPVTLPAPAKQHRDYCADSELLIRLSPRYMVPLRSIANDMGWGYQQTVTRLTRLQRDGFNFQTMRGLNGLNARLTKRTWMLRAERIAEQYYDRVYGGER